MTPLILTEEQMQDKFLCKAAAAHVAGVTSRTISNWQRAKKIRVEPEGVPLSEALRKMVEVAERRA